MRQPDSKFQCTDSIDSYLLARTPHVEKIVPTFPFGGTKNFYRSLRSESRFVPLTFKIVSPPQGGETIYPADGSSTRSGSTSVRGRVRSPHISDGRPAAGSQRTYSLGSCVTQPACYSLGWDRQTDGHKDGSRIVHHCSISFLFILVLCMSCV